MRKTLFLTILILLVSFTAQAQISKGTIFVGGSLGFESSNTDNKVGNTETRTFERTSFSVAPSIGFFVANRTAVGLRASFSNTENVDIENNGDKTINTRIPVNIGVFADRYFMLIPEFGFTTGFFANFVTGSSKREVVDGTTGVAITTENTISGFNTGLNAGTIWFATPHIGISGQVGLLSFSSVTETVNNSNPEISETRTGFNFDASSLNLNFGFHYYFFN